MQFKNIFTGLFKRGKKPVVAICAPIFNELSARQAHSTIDNSISSVAAEYIKRDNPKPQTKVEAGPSVIQQRMKDLQQESKHFKRLDPHEVTDINKATAWALRLSQFEALYNAIISNEVRTMYDLDRLTDSDRDFILSTTPDLSTFESLVQHAWNISRDINGLSPIARKQRIADALSKTFR